MDDDIKIRPRFTTYEGQLIVDAVTKVLEGETLTRNELQALEAWKEKIEALLLLSETRAHIKALQAKQSE